MTAQDYSFPTLEECWDPFGIMSAEQRNRWLVWVFGGCINTYENAFTASVILATAEMHAHFGGERPTTNRRPEPP